MIKITDGNTTKEVTKGMFENLYSAMGYKLVEDKSELKSVRKDETPVKEVSEPKEEKEEVKKEAPTKGFPKTSK